MIEINNRRYIGAKYKLLSNIEEAINNHINEKDYTFADLFAGTGVVAHSFAENGHPVIVNDILYSNVVAYHAWLGTGEYNSEKIISILQELNGLKSCEICENYFSRIYGEKYFSIDCAKKIGYIREYIELHKRNFSEREYYILLTSLLYATDRVANTVGHFEYFLKQQPKNERLVLQNLKISPTAKTQIFNMDANALAAQINTDVVYIDPPYNARQYVNFYHVLENLARWNKPEEFEGNSMKFKRDELKSGYSRSEAPVLFEKLILDLKCKLIVVSYNNTYNAKSNASINKIQGQEIFDIMSKRGNVHVYSFDYKCFNAGKTDFNNHKELLYVCEVSK